MVASIQSFGARAAREAKVDILRGRTSGIASITSQAFLTASCREVKAWAVPGVMLGRVMEGSVLAM